MIKGRLTAYFEIVKRHVLSSLFKHIKNVIVSSLIDFWPNGIRGVQVLTKVDWENEDVNLEFEVMISHLSTHSPFLVVSKSREPGAAWYIYEVSCQTLYTKKTRSTPSFLPYPRSCLRLPIHTLHIHYSWGLWVRWPRVKETKQGASCIVDFVRRQSIRLGETRESLFALVISSLLFLMGLLCVGEAPAQRHGQSASRCVFS